MNIFGPAATSGNSSPVTGTNSSGSSGSSTSSSSSLGSATDPLTQESTFLQLLIAQIQNQDPLNPTDSIQFVGQLVQYSQLEQLLNISKNTQQLATDASSTATSSGSNNSGNTNSGNTNSNTTPVSGSGTQSTQ